MFSKWPSDRFGILDEVMAIEFDVLAATCLIELEKKAIKEAERAREYDEEGDTPRTVTKRKTQTLDDIMSAYHQAERLGESEVIQAGNLRVRVVEINENETPD